MSEDAVARRREVIREAIHRVSCDRRASHDAAFGQCSVSADAVAMDLAALATEPLDAIEPPDPLGFPEDYRRGWMVAMKQARAALSGVPEGAASKPFRPDYTMDDLHAEGCTGNEDCPESCPCECHAVDARHVPVPSPEPLDVERALRYAEAALHQWSVLNTHTDPRESQRMGRAALDEFLRLAAPQPLPEDET